MSSNFDPNKFDFNSIMGSGSSLTDMPEQKESTPAFPETELYSEAQVKAVRNTAPTQVTSPLSSFGFTDDDLVGLPGIEMAAPDATLPRFPIDKYVMKASKKDRLSFLSNNKYSIKYHWSEELKMSLLCFGGACCEDCGSPTLRFVRPVVVYDTDSRGTVLSNKVDLKVWRLAQNGEDQVLTIGQQTSDVSSVDVIVSTTNEDYQTPSIMPISPSTWKSNQEMVASIKHQWDTNKKYLFDALATNLTPEQYFQKKMAAAQQPQTGRR